MIKADWPEHFSAVTLMAQEQFYESLGIYDPARYEKSPVAMSTLMSIIERFQRRGTKVVLLLMPQHSTLVRRVPSEAVDILRRHLRITFPGNEPPLLDFQRTVDGSGFVDLPHLNHKGSLEFSRRLGERLRGLLPNGAPLMAHH